MFNFNGTSVVNAFLQNSLIQAHGLSCQKHSTINTGNYTVPAGKKWIIVSAGATTSSHTADMVNPSEVYLDSGSAGGGTLVSTCNEWDGSTTPITKFKWSETVNCFFILNAGEVIHINNYGYFTYYEMDTSV